MPGPVVLRPFLPARAWRPAVVARLARTLGRKVSHHGPPTSSCHRHHIGALRSADDAARGHRNTGLQPRIAIHQ